MTRWFHHLKLSGFRVETVSRRSTRKNGYKRPVPPDILVKNPNTSGGHQVPVTGEPMLQRTERPLDIWNKTLAIEAEAMAVLTDLQSMRAPTIYLHPWTTAGTLRVNYHLSLQVFLPRSNLFGSHSQI